MADFELEKLRESGRAFNGAQHDFDIVEMSPSGDHFDISAKNDVSMLQHIHRLQTTEHSTGTQHALAIKHAAAKSQKTTPSVRRSFSFFSAFPATLCFAWRPRYHSSSPLSIPSLILLLLVSLVILNDIVPYLRWILHVLWHVVREIALVLVGVLATMVHQKWTTCLNRGGIALNVTKGGRLSHTNNVTCTWMLPQSNQGANLLAPLLDVFPSVGMPSSLPSYFASASGIMPQNKNTSIISSYFYLLGIKNGFTNEYIFPTRLSLRNLLLNILQIQKPDGNKRRSATRSELVRKSLLVITTKNLLHITKLTFYSLRLHRELPDILVVDDFSMENVVDDLHVSFGKDLPIVGYITKKQAKGLTDSWNRAYKWFKARKQYEFLIMSNNDVLIPEGALTWMMRCLAAGYPLCKPLGTATGVGDRPNQDVWRVLRGIVDIDYVHKPENYIKIQRLLEARRDLVPFWRDNFPFNGFFYAMRRDAMERAEFDPDRHLLFDPKCVNVKNEDDLTRRIGKSFHGLCQKCFILHFKNLTIQKGEKKGKEEKIVGDWRELLVTDAGHYPAAPQGESNAIVEKAAAAESQADEDSGRGLEDTSIGEQRDSL